MAGIGRKMPITMFAFLIGSLSIVGLPPFGGLWSKWLLTLGALEAGHGAVVGVLMVSSILNVAYLLPIVARAFFLPAPAEGAGMALSEAPAPCLIALSVTALLCIILFFQADRLQALLLQLFTAP
jgi:multicomponent Na+:H+ antiporter subunit D